MNTAHTRIPSNESFSTDSSQNASFLNKPPQTNLVHPYPPGYHSGKPDLSLDPPKPRRPPSLQYDIASKKKSIIITWTVIVFSNAILPLGLFYILRYGTGFDEGSVINITTSTQALGVIQWPWRLWKLLRRGGERAPKDRTWLTWDSFQWNFLIKIFPVTLLCILATMKNSIRLLAAAPISAFALTTAQLLVFSALSRTNFTLPVRQSSRPPGAPLRPPIYLVIEDITACDGAGGQTYRERLNVRYEASPPFRKLIYNLSVYLGLSFAFMIVMQVVLIAVLSENVSYGVSTVLLWGWSGLMAWWGVWYARRALEEEKLWWLQNEGDTLQV